MSAFLTVALVQFVDSEVPSGTADGHNLMFTLAHTPNPPASCKLYRAGLRLVQGSDYTLNGAAITFALGSQPQATDALVADYRY